MVVRQKSAASKSRKCGVSRVISDLRELIQQTGGTKARTLCLIDVLTAAYDRDRKDIKVT